MKKFAFPFKVLKTSDITSGSVFDIPAFCQKQKSNSTCRRFYSELKCNSGLCRCPYGFAAEMINYGGQDIILTCLNIETVSSRKELKKRIKESEFLPKLTIQKYQQIKAASIDELNESSSCSNELVQARENAILENDREALDNAIHEIHNLTNQLTSRADKLSTAISRHHLDIEYIDVLSKNIYAISNLMAIRLDSYKLEVDPSNIKAISRIPIGIFKKVEKAYKCLHERASQKELRINLVGKSYNTFEAGPLLEIAFFIILENAIKYSPQGSTITVNFNEKGDTLTLSFSNWSIRPDKSESIKRYVERGYRGKSVENQNTTEGRGIGMYLLNQICATFGVKFSYNYNLKEHKSFNNDGYSYAIFHIDLKFSGMEICTPPDYNEYN